MQVRPLTKLFSLMLALLSAAPAWAVEFRSIGAPAVVMYDAPSAQAKKLFLADRQYPVEIIVTLGEWFKVRDIHGELAWVEGRHLSPTRMLMVTASPAEVRAAADPASAVTFRAEKDVVLELLEVPAAGWAKVRHRDGMTGFIQSSQVWGL